MKNQFEKLINAAEDFLKEQTIWNKNQLGIEIRHAKTALQQPHVSGQLLAELKEMKKAYEKLIGVLASTKLESAKLTEFERGSYEMVQDIIGRIERQAISANV